MIQVDWMEYSVYLRIKWMIVLSSGAELEMH